MLINRNGLYPGRLLAASWEKQKVKNKLMTNYVYVKIYDSFLLSDLFIKDKMSIVFFVQKGQNCKRKEESWDRHTSPLYNTIKIVKNQAYFMLRNHDWKC